MKKSKGGKKKPMKIIRIVFLVLFFIGIILIFSSEKTPELSVSASKPTPIVVNRAPAPTKTKGEPKNHKITVSGGIGVSKMTWEKHNGVKPSKPCLSVAGITQCTYGVTFTTIRSSGSVPLDLFNVLKITWKNSLSLTKSREQAKQYIPNDSILLNSYDSKYTGSKVDLFDSKWLAGQYPDEESIWKGGARGNFIVVHGGGQGIYGVTIGTGNNP